MTSAHLRPITLNTSDRLADCHTYLGHTFPVSSADLTQISQLHAPNNSWSSLAKSASPLKAFPVWVVTTVSCSCSGRSLRRSHHFPLFYSTSCSSQCSYDPSFWIFGSHALSHGPSYYNHQYDPWFLPFYWKIYVLTAVLDFVHDSVHFILNKVAGESYHSYHLLFSSYEKFLWWVFSFISVAVTTRGGNGFLIYNSILYFLFSAKST